MNCPLIDQYIAFVPRPKEVGMKIFITALFLVVSLPLIAQVSERSLPDSPSYTAALHSPAALPAITSTPRRIRPTFTQEDRDPHRRGFMLLSATAVVSTVADIELTAHCLATNPNCREANPLFGSHPSRARMYAIAMPMTAAQIWFSNHLRKKHPERKLWMLPTISVTVVHSLGAMSTTF